MSTLYNIAGTTYKSFTIGGGTTIHCGNGLPDIAFGRPGDMYVQMNYVDDSGAILGPCGKIYVKVMEEDGVSFSWQLASSTALSFDTPVINGNFDTESRTLKISNQHALIPSTTTTTSTPEDDWNDSTTHNSYGVVRFATETEATNGDKNYLAITPVQLKTSVDAEKERAEGIEADLQDQIDTINIKHSIVDMVGTKADLDSYDTTKLNDKDAIEVLVDETQGGATTVYRWHKDTSTWEYIGETNAYYTIAQMDALLDDKADDNKVLHLAGAETVTGNKTFNGTVTLKSTTTATTQAKTDNSTKVATTAFVKTAVSDLGTLKQDKISVSESTVGKFLTNDGSSVVWSNPTLSSVEDVDITNPSQGQSLVYNETTQKFENGTPIAATIKYW